MLHQLTIRQAHEGLKAKKFSARDLAQACLDQINKTDSKIKSYITLTPELALKAADATDAKINKGGDLGELEGIPVAVKDIIATEGVLTTAASNILKNYVAPYDAAIIQTLKKAGVSILGKTNLDAFAHGSSTENSDFFVTRNPWDLERVPGGSSGGSASAVAANQCLFSLGSDTGGSIRQPAGYCNIVGLKPTYGRISRYGFFAMTSSTDCPSIMTKDVADSALLLREVAGQDEKDGTTVPVKVPDYTKELNQPIKGLKIGVPKEYFTKGMNPEVERSVRDAIKHYESLGAQIREISLPHSKYALAVYYIITPSEVSTNLSRFDGIRYGYSIVNDASRDTAKNLLEVYTKSRRYGFGSEAKRRIMVGTYALSSGYHDAYYRQASRVRTLLRRDFADAFQKVDLILTPTSPGTAFKVGQKGDDPLQMYLEDLLLVAISLAGVPAMTVPCGFATPDDVLAKSTMSYKPEKKDGASPASGQAGGQAAGSPKMPVKMPVGMQLIANYFQEGTIFRAAHAYEQSTRWHKMRAPLG